MEIKKLVSNAKETATKILTEQRERLDKLANALLEKETMDAAEIRTLLDLPPAPAAEEKPAPEAPAAEPPSDGTPA